MLSLTYLSTEVLRFDDRQLDALLGHARATNQERGLSGMLLYAQGQFIQTLEGPADAVRQTFGEIATDPRHRNVYVTMIEDVEERAFPDWSMGFERRNRQQLADLPGYNDFLSAAPQLRRTAQRLGRAGVFHHVFRQQAAREESRQVIGQATSPLQAPRPGR